MKQLTPGAGRDRVRLWDNQWCAMYDSATATTPAYKHIAGWVWATIDHPDGTRWVGQFCRTREGIIREKLPKLPEPLLKWPTYGAGWDRHEP